MSLGASLAGVEVVMAVERDIHAASTYRRNHPACNLFVGDIREYPAEAILSIPKGSKPTVVFGGPPCPRVLLFQYSYPHRP